MCDGFKKLTKKDLVNFLLNVNHFPPPPTEQLHRGGICLLQNAAANKKYSKPAISDPLQFSLVSIVAWLC